RQHHCPDDPQALDDRKRPPLGARHDLPRRRLPGANRQRSRQPDHYQDRPERATNRKKQGLPAYAPQSRRMGRKRPRLLPCPMTRSIDSPDPPPPSTLSLVRRRAQRGRTKKHCQQVARILILCNRLSPIAGSRTFVTGSLVADPTTQQSET